MADMLFYMSLQTNRKKQSIGMLKKERRKEYLAQWKFKI
jgi:hypothetical protein